MSSARVVFVSLSTLKEEADTRVKVPSTNHLETADHAQRPLFLKPKANDLVMVCPVFVVGSSVGKLRL